MFPSGLPNSKTNLGLLTVLLDARGAQAGKAVAFDGTLPTQIFLNREGITLAGFFQTQEPAPDCRNNLCLAADHPPVRTGWRKIGDGQGTAIGTDDVIDARTQLTIH